MTFSDVRLTDYFYGPVQQLFCRGVISGYTDNTFRPGNNTTRGQLSKIIVLAEGWTLDCPATPHFSDVPPNNPFFCYVETAYAHSIISGYADGTFRPGNNVTRAQLCKIVVLAEGWELQCPASGHFSDVQPTDPFYCYIETAYSHGVITGYGDGTFRPGNSATRGQICKIVYQAVMQP
jgi:nitrogen fixation protein